MSSLSFTLQLGTLMPVLLGVTLVRVLAMWHYSRLRRVYPGFRTLLLSAFLVFVSIAALLLRARLGESVLTVLFANAVLLAHPVLVYHGLGLYGRLPHLRARTVQNAALVALMCLVQMADAVFDPNPERRVLIFTVVSLFLALRIGLELPLRCGRHLPGFKIWCFSYLVTAGLQILRGVNVIEVPGYILLNMQQAEVIGVYSVLYRILQSSIELYAVFAMNSAMLEDDLQVATSQLERLARTDALTGVANRRGLFLAGPEILAGSYADRKPAAVLMLDLDRFKQVNDRLGHATGDELLRCVAGLCVRSLRREDLFARYGGEEFAVVAPRTSASEARALAERIRTAVSLERFAPLGGEAVTVSIGVACACSGSLEELLKKADETLYLAKQNGRDRVELFVLEEGRPPGLAEA